MKNGVDERDHGQADVAFFFTLAGQKRNGRGGGGFISSVSHSGMRISPGLLVVACSVASGQGVTVRGVAYDSLHARPLAGAFVAIGTKGVSADSAGRFTIEGVPPGNYRVTAQHDDIDRLGMSAIGAQIRVTDGSDPIVVSLPSFAGLWRITCGPAPPPADTGFVFGTVRPVRAARPTTVSASWIDIAATGTTISQKLRTLEIEADSLGNFALCGVPTTTGLSLRARSDSVESGEFQVGPLDRERVVRRDLALGMAFAVATIRGRILADSGRGPLANVDVTLVGVGQSTTTNARGEYGFNDLPPGTHRLWARKIGYAEVDIGVDVEAAEHRERDIVMRRIITLDSVAVTATLLPRDEALRLFDEHRKLGLGRFLTLAELEKKSGVKLSTLLMQWPGLTIPTQRPTDTWPLPNRGIKSIGGGGCRVAVFLDGRRLDHRVDHDLDHIAPPETLAGIEWYPGGASVPPMYARLNAHCGVLVLHSRYKAGK